MNRIEKLLVIDSTANDKHVTMILTHRGIVHGDNILPLELNLLMTYGGY